MRLRPDILRRFPRPTRSAAARPAQGSPLLQNLFWNLGGTCAPMLAAVVCIPIMVHVLGAQRFGVLTIAWAVITASSLLDFVSTALTKLIAERIGTDRSDEVPPLFWIAFLLTLVPSVVLGAAFAAVCPLLVGHALKVPEPLRPEAIQAFYFVGAALPAVMLGRMLRAALAGFQRFDLVNYVRIPLGVFMFLGSVMVLPFTHSLVWAVAAMTFAWIASSLVQLVLCFVVIPGLARGPFIRLSVVGPLLSFGGWMTIFNFTVPLMTYADRFVISAMVSMSAVAWYATPHEIVTKLYIVSAAGGGVLLPALAESLGEDRGSVARLVRWGLRCTFLAMFPIMLVTEALGRDGLRLWLDAGFAQHGTVPLQFLAIGIFFNAMGTVPLMLVLAAHRPDVPAKIHLAEAPCYLALLAWLTYGHGITGAGAAAAMMFTCDGLAWFGAAWMLVPGLAETLRESLWTMLASAPVLAFAAMLPDVLALKIGFLCVSLALFAFWALRTLSQPVPLTITVQRLVGASRESA